MKIIETKEVPAAGPYSQAVITGGLVYTSGQIPVDPAAGAVTASGIEAQTRQAVRNLRAVLEAAGSSLDRVVKTTCYLKDMGDFPVFNRVYGEAFPQKPARSCLEAAALPKGALLEIEAVAEAD